MTPHVPSHSLPLAAVIRRAATVTKSFRESEEAPVFKEQAKKALTGAQAKTEELLSDVKVQATELLQAAQVSNRNQRLFLMPAPTRLPFSRWSHCCRCCILAGQVGGIRPQANDCSRWCRLAAGPSLG